MMPRANAAADAAGRRGRRPHVRDWGADTDLRRPIRDSRHRARVLLSRISLDSRLGVRESLNETVPRRHGVSTARFLRVQVRVMRWRAAAPSGCAGSQLAGHPNGFPDEGDLRREEDVPLVGPRLRAACPVMHLSLAGSTRDFARRAGPRWALPCGCRAAIGAMRAGTSWRGRGASWWRGGELSG